MPEQSDLDRRLRAVERALTDGDHDVAGLQDATAIVERLDEAENRIDDLEERIAELDAATQAVRGYVGNVRSVNEAVEERADAALAAIDRIEAQLDNREGTAGDPRTERHRSNRQPPDAGRNDASVTASTAGAGVDGNRHGIEMPPPGSNPARAKSAEEDDVDDDRSVIERVREAL